MLRSAQTLGDRPRFLARGIATPAGHPLTSARARALPPRRREVALSTESAASTPVAGGSDRSRSEQADRRGQLPHSTVRDRSDLDHRSTAIDDGLSHRPFIAATEVALGNERNERR